VASNTILQKRARRRPPDHAGLPRRAGDRALRTPDLFDLTWEKPEPWSSAGTAWRSTSGSPPTARRAPLDREGLLAAAERLVADGADVWR